MIEIKINGKDLTTFNGIFVSFIYASSNYTNGLIVNGMSIINTGAEITPGNRELRIVFEEELSMSNFYSELSKKAIIEIDDGLFYECYLSGKPVVSHLGCRKYDVKFPLYAICKGNLIEHIHPFSFNVLGNLVCGAIYEITTQEDKTDFEVDGISVKKLLSKNTLVVDGIDKLVYYSETPNISAFDDIDIIKFPSLEPGLHTVSKPSGISVTIKYYPLYI